MGDQGCVILPDGRDKPYYEALTLESKLPDAATQPWPMGDADSQASVPSEIDGAALAAAVDAAFADPDALTAAFVVVHKGRIEILDKIYFETDKATIKPVSFPILNAIAATLKGNPQILLVQIQGHADERGTREYNLALGERRANAARDYLMALGVSGGRVLTIEALETPDGLHPIQQAFVDQGAIQCGFCTPGMILTAKNLLDDNPRPNEQEIRKAISGNLCRCTGYQKIVEAIQEASNKMSS